MGSRIQVICVPLEIDIKRKIVFSAVSIDRILMSTREPNHRNTMLWHHSSPLSLLCTYTYHSSEKRGLQSTFLSSEMLQNAIFIEKENPRSVFRFSFRAVLSFTLWMPGLVYVDIDWGKGIHKVKLKMKNEKNCVCFLFL